MQIIVFALQSDLHADSVVYHLNKKGIGVIRIDPTLDKEIPEKTFISSALYYNAYYEFHNNMKINPLECNGIFCRFAIDILMPNSEDPLKKFSLSESLTAFLAPLRIIESARWINDPWIENRVDCKILQSKIAKDIGMKTPEFIISSNYNDLLSFYNEYENVIIKPLSDTPLALVGEKFIKDEELYTESFHAPYSTKFSPNKNIDITNIDNTPTFLQVEIKKRADIRATIIDEKLFAVEIPYREGNPIDFRLNRITGIKEFNISNDLKDKLIELVKRLGLRFASCDLILDTNNQIFFLESNVQGNWLWTEINENINISETIANALIKE